MGLSSQDHLSSTASLTQRGETEASPGSDGNIPEVAQHSRQTDTSLCAAETQALP